MSFLFRVNYFDIIHLNITESLDEGWDGNRARDELGYQNRPLKF